ncbi:hypothetical protein Desaci_4763 (plasmid) [Desulfosporosinus acidiphilus SJ4]|uniref:Uncharacterized protein n=1 Tax=Desulfosporosinus acidiphilus (strain DSM 22704 / JCM 16185 / SJ4) TaxID=646529 RepID=I4DCR5_DESAJ|nr:hypothetical protein [Desulfosporosinus acidiphilus]AFM43589.1 hypothetical protein Desaci_4763 [Desulfosporosinus acidiphilus SJ4]
MLKRDKNGFLQILMELGFDTEQFEAFEEERDDSPAFVIRLKESPIAFWTRNSINSYSEYDCAYILFGPTYSSSGYFPDQRWSEDINDVYNEFREWLTRHVKPYLEELSVPDLWSQVEDQQDVFGMLLTENEDFSMFTNEERVQLGDAVRIFRYRIQEVFEPTQNQLKQIDYKLNYLLEAANKLNKFDWKSVLLSTLIGIATTMSLDTNSGRTLFYIAKQVFTETIKLLH